MPPLVPYYKAILEQVSTADAAYDDARAFTATFADELAARLELPGEAWRIGGSVGKGTAVNPLSDVDLYLYVPEAMIERARGDGVFQPGTVLARIERHARAILDEIHGPGRTGLVKQGHSIGIRFRARGRVGIDLVPAIYHGRSRAEVYIPRRGTDTYVQTSIERQLQLIETLDTPGRPLRRAIRLLKVWLADIDAGMPKYALEVLALHAVWSRRATRTEGGIFEAVLAYIEETRLREPVCVEHFFAFAPPANRTFVIYDPAVPDNELCPGLYAADADRMATAASRALRALGRAEDAAAAGRERPAWKHLAAVFPTALS